MRRTLLLLACLMPALVTAGPVQDAKDTLESLEPTIFSDISFDWVVFVSPLNNTIDIWTWDDYDADRGVSIPDHEDDWWIVEWYTINRTEEYVLVFGDRIDRDFPNGAPIGTIKSHLPAAALEMIKRRGVDPGAYVDLGCGAEMLPIPEFDGRRFAAFVGFVPEPNCPGIDGVGWFGAITKVVGK